MDVSVVIAACSFIIAVFSPAVTEYVRYKHERRVRDFDFFIRHRAEVIERYLSEVCRCCSSSQYGFENLPEAYLYIPKELWPLMDEIASELTYSGDGPIGPHKKAAMSKLLILSKNLLDVTPRLKK